MTDITTRLRAARNVYADSPELGHILHDAEAVIDELMADNARLIGANLVYQGRERPSHVLCEFAGWLSENGEDLHELPNSVLAAIVVRFLDERPGPCPDCGGKGGTAPNGVHYCNCEDAE